MKKLNDKTKKIALAAALITVGIGSFCGIREYSCQKKPQFWQIGNRYSG